jgi:ABC-type Fe3+/spermidine/putrescine transport system ATPase subunit
MAIKRQRMTTALISLKGIVKRYVRGKQRVQVLHGIDLEIRAAEFLALMGPSGSGKTTLLNLIGGIHGFCVPVLQSHALADRPAKR